MPTRPAAVAGRSVFYNNSAFDGRIADATAADLAAVAADKTAVPGGASPGALGAASFASVTSFVKGINGVLVHLAGGLPGGLTAADFVFRVGRAGDPGTWPLAPAPSAVTLLPADLGATTHRYAVTWLDGAIKNTWLQVTVKANDRTGLARPDVFYCGNLVGETGDGSGALPLRVTAMDLAAVRRNTFSAAPITSRYNFNRDGRVNALDVVAVRSNLGQTLAPFGAAPVIAAAERRTVGQVVLILRPHDGTTKPGAASEGMHRERRRICSGEGNGESGPTGSD